MNCLVLGSTGVVGDAVVREALGDGRIARLFAVTRRPLKHDHPKLTTITLADFGDFEPLAAQLAETDAVLCALGLSWYQANGEADYRRITHDYVMACARVAAVANPAVRFCFVSGHGASSTSSQAWARIKAETEKDLHSILGSRVTVFRPGYIYPAYGRETRYWGDSLMRPFLPFRALLTKYMTDSAEVARAVLHCATGGAIPNPADNRAIIAAAGAYLQSRS